MFIDKEKQIIKDSLRSIQANYLRDINTSKYLYEEEIKIYEDKIGEIDKIIEKIYKCNSDSVDIQ